MGLLQDIYQKISSQSNKYGKYHKTLFHLHTYASHDYAVLEKYRNSDTKISYEELCELCYEKKLFSEKELEINLAEIHNRYPELYADNKEILIYLLIAWELIIDKYEIVLVTDHNNIDGYDKLYEAINIIFDYRKADMKRHGNSAPKIILGIEVSCADKNHVVGIFDAKVERIKEKIAAFIEENIMGDDSGSYQTSLSIIDQITKLGGIAYIAHINSSPMMNDAKEKRFLSGAYTKKLFGDSKLNILGVHHAEDVIKVKNRIRNYTSREFTYIVDSDAHSIDTIKDSFFWVKGEQINFKMLKEAIRDSYIAIQLKTPEPPNSFIEGILLKNKNDGFLIGAPNQTNKEFTLNFSCQLNCAIGGRGSGKSTLLNLIELVLSQNFISEEIYNELCKYDQIWLLYSHNKKEYLINFMPMVKEYEGDSYFAELDKRTEQRNHIHYRNLKEKKKFYREIILKDCIHIYPIQGGKVTDRHISNNILNSFFDRSYSVNELVQTANSNEINTYISDVMDLGFKNITETENFRSVTGLKKFLRLLDQILLARKQNIDKAIDKFNTCRSASGKLRVVYHQNKNIPDFIDFDYLMENFQQVEDKNGFYRKKNITIDGIIGFLDKVYKKYGLIEFLRLLLNKKLSMVDIDIMTYLIPQTEKMIDRGIQAVEKKDRNNLLNEINDDILNNSINYLINLMRKEYLTKVETFSLEFNIMNREGGKKELYKDVRQLSLGQKVVAMLSFIFSYSEYKNDNRPLLIDQPEDNLDNQYIYKNLVDDLRKIKDKRQVLIATHSATIVTNAKAEQVIVLESDGTHGWISHRGYPTEKVIKQQIINYMEGGTESFLHKMDIYRDVLQKH